MQSGISASQELLSQFNSLQTSTTHFGLLANIVNESLEPVEFLTPSSPATAAGFSSNLSLLTPHLKDNEALYLILRRYDTTPAFLAITYVPDRAPVRQKMLFASTRLTLVRELGTEHFRETILANAASELTADGFKKHDAHTAIEAPLTEQERELGAVKQAEMEAGRGTGKKNISLSSHMSMPISDDALEVMKQFGSGAIDIAMFKIDPANESIIIAPDAPTSTPSSIGHLASSITTEESRFTFFRYVHTYNGEESSPAVFFYTRPSSANNSIKNRMLYPLMKRAVITVAAQRCGVKTAKSFEVDTPSEITEEAVLDDLHPKLTTNTRFARPKRPGR